MPAEHFVVHSIEWRVGRFCALTPIEVYVHYETPGPGRGAPAAIEEMTDKEFAALIMSGMAEKIG